MRRLYEEMIRESVAELKMQCNITTLPSTPLPTTSSHYASPTPAISVTSTPTHYLLTTSSLPLLTLLSTLLTTKLKGHPLPLSPALSTLIFSPLSSPLLSKI